jgi:hypothetical protein
VISPTRRSAELQPEQHVRSERQVKRGFPRRVRWERVYSDGWVIIGGSNRRSGGKSEGQLSAIIWTDGEIGTDHPFNSDGDGWGLNDGALATMARMLGINTTPKAGTAMPIS